MGSAELAMVLDDMMKRVLDGDSYEGHIQYTMPEAMTPEEERAGWPSADAEFWVTGAYRIGNLQGQGGMRMIGTVPPAVAAQEPDQSTQEPS
jgi:hypothetical protein